LNKAIYGLKQAARCCFEVYKRVLKGCGFKNSPVDRCIYVLDKGDVRKKKNLFFNVDDLVMATTDVEKMKCFKSYLMDKLDKLFYWNEKRN